MSQVWASISRQFDDAVSVSVLDKVCDQGVFVVEEQVDAVAERVEDQISDQFSGKIYDHL